MFMLKEIVMKTIRKCDGCPKETENCVKIYKGDEMVCILQKQSFLDRIRDFFIRKISY